MSYARYQFRQRETPGVVQVLIWITCLVSIFSALSSPVFSYFHITTPQEILSLSWLGIKNFYLWQFFSYLFVQQSWGIDFAFIITLFFNMYILWFVGEAVVSYAGQNSFLTLYFLSGLIAAVCALAITQFGFIAGCGAPIYALLVVWMMMNPEMEMYLFFLIPMKAKWVVVGLLGMIFLISLSQMDLVNLVFMITGVLTGYFYSLFMLKLRGPFEFTKTFENKILNLFRKKEPKIYDFKTGKPKDSDDAFMDAMLAKISAKGEQSLTPSERKRMREISERRNR